MKKQFKNIIILLALLFPLSAFAANPAVLFVFDGSGSMWGQVDGKTKIELAKEAMSGLVKDFPAGTDIGLISYGHRKKGDCNDIETLASLGSSKDSVISAIQSINPKGKTPLTKSIQIAAELLKERDAPTSIVVISDGKESCNADPCAAAKAVREAGVNLKIHVVGFDVKKEEAEQLQCIAKNGGGKYFAAANANELAKSFAEVKKEVVEAKPKPVEKKPEAKVVFHDDFNDEFLSDQWEIMNPNEETMVVEDGYLQIITDPAKGTFLSPTNFVLLNHELKGEYEITLKMKFTAIGRRGNWTENQWAGLILYKDKDNGIILILGSYFQQYVAKFNKIKNNAFTLGFSLGMNGFGEERDFTIRIQRIKRKFIASFLNAKGKWQKIGEYTVLNPKYTKVGIFASRHSGYLENMEKFDSFTFKQIK